MKKAKVAKTDKTGSLSEILGTLKGFLDYYLKSFRLFAYI